MVKKPRLIIWVLTSKCNLACPHCYAAKFIGRDELNERQALRVVKSGAEAGIKHVGFTGGEVFLRKDALNLMRYASQLGMSTSVITNGSMLTEEVVRDLANIGVFAFLSLDGANKELVSIEEVQRLGDKIGHIDSSMQVCVLGYRPEFRRKHLPRPSYEEMLQVHRALRGVGLKRVICQVPRGHIGPEGFLS